MQYTEGSTLINSLHAVYREEAWGALWGAGALLYM